MKDYYQILEVPSNASQDTIKEQYRFLVHAWHPDKFPNPIQKAKAETKLKEIIAAYEILGNPVKRAEYDKTVRSSRVGYAQERGRQAEREAAHRQAEDERHNKEEAARHAREEQWRKERAERERAKTERCRADYERQQQEKLERERLEAERRRVENYGIEVVICSSCGTINSLAFSRCIKCSKDMSKERPINNPYLSEKSEERQRTEAEKLRQQRKERLEAERRRAEYERQRKSKLEWESSEAERRRVEKYGIEIVICSSCGTKNSLSFSRCLKCSKDLTREKPVDNPYL